MYQQSVPNFELWVLLHFRDFLAPFHRNEEYASLRRPQHYPAYAKNSKTGAGRGCAAESDSQ